MISKPAMELARRQEMKRSRQEKLDKHYCRPGYQWNEVIGKCVLPYAAVERELSDGPAPSPEGPMDTGTPTSTSTVDEAIRAEKNKRRATAQKTAPMSGEMGALSME